MASRLAGRAREKEAGAPRLEAQGFGGFAELDAALKLIERRRHEEKHAPVKRRKGVLDMALEIFSQPPTVSCSFFSARSLISARRPGRVRCER